MLDLNGSNLLITGGTGSFGKKFIQILFQKFPGIKKLVVFSRDEYKQYEMSREFSGKEYKAIQYILGDVRDRDRLTRAFEGIDYVIHAAALKQVPSAEFNPMEFIKTNVLGAENVIEAAFHSGVKKVVCLSTDKASSPVSLYGATKLCADKLFVAANYLNGNRETKFSVVRYGNVIGSRGSVVPLFLEEKKKGVIP
ncbi:MAG: polysaccharide biosynthesis protein, partial [Cytophagaceae bacterium]